jgi:hypothetical protein
MANGRIHDSTTSNVLAWSTQNAHLQHELEDEASAEVDEPPDDTNLRHTPNNFKRTTVRKTVDHSKSLLTKALHHCSDDEGMPPKFNRSPSRRRSMNSNISLASTADLTSDTGLTSPARTNTPSPPPPVVQLSRLNVDLFNSKPVLANGHSGIAREDDATPTKKSVDMFVENRPDDKVVEVLAKRRCISFACGPKTEAKKPTSAPRPSQTAADVKPQQPPPRRTCIKFACTSKPSERNTPPQETRVLVPEIVQPSKADRQCSPTALRKYRTPSTTRSARSLTPRRQSQSPITVRTKKYLTANSADLNLEASRFHEFASDEPQEEDWIRQNLPATTRRLTINDTLQKENEIRRLGKEAEEEALQEELEEDGLDGGDDDMDNPDEEDGLEEDDVDEQYNMGNDRLGYGSDDDTSDGYNTDNEVGFADSDGEDDGDDDLDLWTHGQASALQLSGATPVNPRPSVSRHRSDSSSSTSDIPTSRRRESRERTRRIKIRPGTPELPDSTDFVCGTLDEDRPLEDAYISCIAQRRREKLHVIPQDIDPSFPTSEPEDEEAELGKTGHDSDDHVWIHGELEDLHHEHDRSERRKKRGDHSSPKRYHSPPPKQRHHSPPPKSRHHSPAPKARGRSPRRLFDRTSPRRLVSPPPVGRAVKSPPASPADRGIHGPIDFKTLASRPGLTHTKSLPRAPAIFPPHFKGQRRRYAAHTGAQGHVRGAIDIVRGLEQKRQRRREKYIQKQCNRARKGQVTEKRPLPGKGAERMRELGLHMAGKHAPGNYVLSV